MERLRIDGGSALRLAKLTVSSLRTKLVLFSLVLVLAPGGVFGLIAISSGRRALTEAVGRELAEEARAGADELSAKVADELAKLRTFASQDLMREIRIGDLDKRIGGFLVSLRREEDSIIELRATDVGGRIVASTDPSQVGTFQSRGNGEAIAEPTAEVLRGPVRIRGIEALELSVPIPDPDAPASILGTLAAVYEWRRETMVLDRIRQNLLDVGFDADVLVVDEAGRVIGGAVGAGEPLRIGTDLRRAGWASAGAALASSQAGFVAERPGGVLVGYRRLAGDQRWTVMVTRPLPQALAPVMTMTVGLGAVLAAVLAVALATAIALANRVAAPLRELTLATRAVTAGDEPMPAVQARSSDEVGELTRAFNQMIVDLRRAQSELLEAAKFAFVGELSAGVAHEVRTSLGVLRSSAQILQPPAGGTAVEAEGRELIGIMIEEIDHLDSVITQLLELGRPREPAIARSPLSDVVFRAADFVEAQARAKGVALRRASPPTSPVALCDEEQIYQVALNLIVNAVQMLPAGGEVRVSVLPQRNGSAAFEVRDDGPGIPADLREKIFQPFFTRRDGGVGLGLTFVRRVVREHHGKLSLESDVGVGTRFTVELPAAEGAA